jgi:hypothetical protein
VFQIEVFNALQMRHNLSQGSPSKRNPKLKMKMSFEVFNINMPVEHCSYKNLFVKFDSLLLLSRYHLRPLTYNLLDLPSDVPFLWIHH